jgi:hypothetical protein
LSEKLREIERLPRTFISATAIGTQDKLLGLCHVPSAIFNTPGTLLRFVTHLNTLPRRLVNGPLLHFVICVCHDV